MTIRRWIRHHGPTARIGALGLAVVLAVTISGCGALVSTAPPLKATYSPHVTQPYASPAATTPLYQATLTQPTTGWSTQPVCTFTAQGLVVKPAGGQAYICLAPVPSIAAVTVTATVQQLSGAPGHAFGLAFRHNDPKSYYFFGVDNLGRYTLAIVVNDVSHTVVPFTANAAIHHGPGATNELQVVAQGQTVTLIANGTALGQAQLTTFVSGTVGLRGINDGEVRFTNLTVTKA